MEDVVVYIQVQIRPGQRSYVMMSTLNSKKLVPNKELHQVDVICLPCPGSPYPTPASHIALRIDRFIQYMARHPFVSSKTSVAPA